MENLDDKTLDELHKLQSTIMGTGQHEYLFKIAEAIHRKIPLKITNVKLKNQTKPFGG